MKKLIILLSLVLFVSCSKSEDKTQTYLPLTYQNLVGKWNFKSVIRANGTIVPFVGLCPAQTDYIEVFNYGKIVTYNYYQDCVSTSNHGCSDYTYNANNMIMASSFLFDNATVTNLNASGFRIEFAEPRSLNFMIDINDAKAVVFEKK